ncbi:MAG: hypothetical protein JNK47_16860 [Mesorhizobium sp.]|nr:hypothetical protein [Mesorhizobium sp.]MBL8578896.1 hypothetical protein [Mesorhizobium sp.]
MPQAPLAATGEAMPIDRHRIQRIIDNLIDLLDSTEPDPDFEPNLGWARTWSGAPGEFGNVDDREGDDEREDDHAERFGIGDLDGLIEQWPSQFGEMAI